jgi:hypothetical protein
LKNFAAVGGDGDVTDAETEVTANPATGAWYQALVLDVYNMRVSLPFGVDK